MNNNKTITNSLYKGRMNRKFSVKKVSEILEITEESISKAENIGMVNARTLFKLLDFYELEIKVFDKFGNKIN